jgi:hypothetical protein
MSEPIQCPKCNQFKFEAPFMENKGSGLAPLVLSFIVFFCASFFGSSMRTVINYIGVFLFLLGIGTSIYTLFIQKRNDVTYKCKNCDYKKNYLK